MILSRWYLVIWKGLLISLLSYVCYVDLYNIMVSSHSHRIQHNYGTERSHCQATQVSMYTHCVHCPPSHLGDNVENSVHPLFNKFIPIVTWVKASSRATYSRILLYLYIHFTIAIFWIRTEKLLQYLTLNHHDRHTCQCYRVPIPPMQWGQSW